MSGPAAALMQVRGFAPSSQGTFSCYEDLLDVFIQDIRDPINVKGAIRLDTLMTDERKSIGLAREILELATP